MTLTAGAVAALVCVTISVAIVIGMHGKDVNDNRHRAVEATERVVVLVREGRLPRVLRPRGVRAIQVLDVHRRVIAASEDLVGKPAIASFHPAGGELTAVRDLCPPTGLTGCMTVASHWAIQPEGNWVVYAGRPVPGYGGPTFVLLLAGVSLLVTAMTAAGAYRVVGRTLAPVDAIRSEVAEITATGLGRRVPVPKNRDEIRSLAETVNDTLDRVESAYEQLRRFTSDASHDLRSPITAMRAQLEEALMYPEDRDWPQMTRAVLQGVERLQAVVTDLLTLARLDAGEPPRHVSTHLAGLVTAELDRYPRKAEIVRALNGGVVVECDRLRLSRLLANLLDNAERHAKSQITVTVRGEPGVAVLEVLDDGDGVPVEMREVVFRRFARLEASRNRDCGGTGLGLAIARQIAEAHGGTLTIEDSEKGARFVLRLPRAHVWM
ncbi:sensor histidine kinase [Actinomadura sp. HBU206391]|uniref:sensor histidine kinase n=1 Tax=Actinomadura sp. HBU206391 TaxID=2731692 RepID=UPI00164F96E2|nr:HAMP domain-containing sensor histidine kinase [Actinomadura sp. HBU206391]MBC6459942.1 HAMP domain-containing histidine kinase [Actinomadura sp. HBU206391]